MSPEKRLQKEIIEWLKHRGAFVIKTSAQPGTPVGCPDVIALIEGGKWVALEVKSSKNSKKQPLQDRTVAKLDGMYYSRFVYPENWQEIKLELKEIL